MHDRLGIAAIALLAVIAFVSIPALIAVVRQHPERRTIMRLTPFALLSFVLWAALFAGAASDKRDDGIIAQYVARLRHRNLMPAVIGGLIVIGVIGSAVTLLR
jgi:hypothetical protein